MKNVFDPQNNFDEWIQNDWESDDYIESHKDDPPPDLEPKDYKWVVLITIVVIVLPIACCAACF